MLQKLIVACYDFNLNCFSAVEFQGFAGSTLRGALGGVFRNLVCVTRAPTCEGCPLRYQCAYGYVFETAPPPSSERLRLYESVPRPYVLDVHDSGRLLFEEGEQLWFTLTLVGRATDYFPYVVLAMERLQESGLGKGRREGRGRFKLGEIHARRADGSTVCVYTPETRLDLLNLPTICGAEMVQQAYSLPTHRLRLRFLTPTRLRFEGRLTDDIQFHHLVRALLHRLSGLLYFHCGAEPETDYAALIAQAQEVRTVHRDLQWVDQVRYSQRQKSVVRMGGFTGEVVFEGDLEPFLPLLVAGEYVHVGKGTVMGMGKIQIVREEEPDNA